MTRDTIALLGLGLLVATTSPARADDQTPKLDTFKKCAAIAEDSARLACFDKAASGFDFDRAKATLKEARTLKAEAEKLRKEKEAIAKAERKRVAELEARKVSDFGKKDTPVETVDEGNFEILKVKKTRLSTFIMLTNNQVWEITEDKKIGILEPGRKVTIKKGFMGNFRMTLQKSGKTAGVKRVF